MDAAGRRRRRAQGAVMLLAGASCAGPSGPVGAEPAPSASAASVGWERRGLARLANLATHRAEALRALRLRVPASEVRDDDVVLIFWDRIDSNQATPVDPSKRAFLGGYWLGADRACVLAWEATANALVSIKDLDVPGPAKPVPPIFLELRAQDDVTRRAFAGIEQVGHAYRRRVPTAVKPLPNGLLEIGYVDGWDEGCGHLSNGAVNMDIARGTLKDAWHME